MSNQKNELLIIQKVLTGDAHAFATLVDTYKDMAVTLAYNILLNREDAEEAAQDAFVKAYKALTAFKGNSKFSTWLFRIIINTSLNKKKAKKPQAIAISELHHDSLTNSRESPPSISMHDQRKYIQLSIQSLNEKERICITLYYLDELSVVEINEATGISTSNIKILLYRGRKKLYAALQGYLKSELTTLI